MNVVAVPNLFSVHKEKSYIRKRNTDWQQESPSYIFNNIKIIKKNKVQDDYFVNL